MKRLKTRTTENEDGIFTYLSFDRISKHLVNGRWAGEILDLYKKLVKEGDNVIDCGAYIGVHTVALSKIVGDNGMVCSFEPHRIYHQLLCSNVIKNGLANVRAFNMGLGAYKEKSKITSRDIFATTDTHYSHSAIVEDRNKEGEVVYIETLDNLDLPKISLIKIDVEGYELNVIKGGLKTIERDSPLILFEYNRQTSRFNYTKEDLFGYLEGLNYYIVQFDQDNYLGTRV